MVLSSSCYFGSELLESRSKEKTEKGPVIFVLDTDIQILPWENLPGLKNQEVYRMPSVRSILLVLDRNSERKQIEYFPVINLSRSYYLLDPEGDLKSREGVFEPLCMKQKWKGKRGAAPRSKYISTDKIEELNGCAAAFLLGCSSGSLKYKGSYAPKGTSLSYLFAGSPVVIGNLWDVTTGDIGRFGAAMLKSWLHNSQLVEKTTNLNEGKEIRIGSCMSMARKECTLKFLVGAAPVCYGVPTFLERGSGKGISISPSMLGECFTNFVFQMLLESVYNFSSLEFTLI